MRVPCCTEQQTWPVKTLGLTTCAMCVCWIVSITQCHLKHIKGIITQPAKVLQRLLQLFILFYFTFITPNNNFTTQFNKDTMLATCLKLYSIIIIILFYLIIFIFIPNAVWQEGINRMPKRTHLCFGHNNIQFIYFLELLQPQKYLYSQL